MDKQALRAEMRARRRALSQAEQEAAAQAVLAQLRSFAPYRKAKNVMAYAAGGGELSLAPVIEDAIRRGKTLLLPRCEEKGVMTARRVIDPSQLVPGAYGLLQPDEACEIMPPDAIELILVPGLAFDRGGGRLGQGGGYYDRFLMKTNALRAGVCHGFALLERVPMDGHDARMDAIVTPQGIEKNREDKP